MKAITNIRLTTQKLAARLYSVAPTRADKQRGASALEYIVLAAAIIVIVGVLATVFGGESNPLSDAFSSLFSTAQGVGGS
ncbi:Flp family type IVb pilin [Alloalcanivorax sp. C16-2]|uniref:Flp family type IVb pilin n=1 Tax=Alloalcanivorax sp. C16-2 TaxID=3390052 RepID=UPI003970BD79